MSSIPETSPFDTFVRPEESLQSFRRFEPVISEFVKAYHKGFGYVANTHNLQSSTYVVRLRDAIRGFFKHQYPSTVVDIEKLATAWQGSVIRAQSMSTIYIGPRRHAAMPAERAYDQGFIEVDISTNRGLFGNLCGLAESGVLGPYKVTCLAEDKDWLISHAEEYDIALDWTSPSSFILV